MTNVAPDKPFHDGGRALEFDLGDFWRWMASDLLSNATRGIVAEFLVAKAVGSDSVRRIEWDLYDVLHPSGIKIEVKASGLVQSWAQQSTSVPEFDIGAKPGGRAADVYVFALHAHADRETADPLDVSQWQFFVLPTSTLNERCRDQKKIRVAPLKGLGAAQVAYDVLNLAIVNARTPADAVESAPSQDHTDRAT